MKKAIFCLLLLNAAICHAQNYQCLQLGIKHYFVNGNGYLRGIRIDSIWTLGDTIVYYPFHTPRGAYITGSGTYTQPALDSNGGSWLGKRVLQKGDGTYIFDSYWNDSVVIKTQASVGDTWVFYSDTSSLYYRATLISIDTMTVLSSLDSVKTIKINAYYGSSMAVSDSLNGIDIILSKNHGFVRVPDLYTFPYHKPDSLYRPGLDFFLDRSTCNAQTINNPTGYGPSANTILFNLVEFVNPNDVQMHNWFVGDEIEERVNYGFMLFGYANTANLLHVVTDKVTSLHTVTYSISSTSAPLDCDPTLFLVSQHGCTFNDNVYPIIDTTVMPETVSPGVKYIFYYPWDSSFCKKSPAYTLVPIHLNFGLGWVAENTSYKLGIGKTFDEYIDGNPTYQTDQLIYDVIHGYGCGSYQTTLVPGAAEEKNVVVIYPNPVTTEITISSSSKLSNIAITNLLGQEVFSGTYDTEKATINVADLSPGMYFVRVNDGVVRKLVKQ